MNHDELALRDALDDLVSNQPAAPADRYAAVRRRVVRHRLRQACAGGGTLAVAAALVTTAVALPGPHGSVASARYVPGWALPWPDHRDGSVPPRVLAGAVSAWRHQAGQRTGRSPTSASVTWYVGQAVAGGQEIAVIFEANSPAGHRLVAGTASTAAVMKGQPAWSADGSSPWSLADVRAPGPRDAGLAIGLNVAGPPPGRSLGPDNWIVVLAGPQVRRLDWTVSTTSGRQSASVSTSRGLTVADTGQVTAPVRLTGLITSQGNVLRRRAYVGVPGADHRLAAESGQPSLPVLALPAALKLPKSFQVLSGFGGSGDIQSDIGVVRPLKPGQQAVVIARCYGPARLQIRLGRDVLSRHLLGVIRCDSSQHELLAPAGQRLSHEPLDILTSPLTSYWVEYGIAPR